MIFMMFTNQDKALIVRGLADRSDGAATGVTTD